MEVKGKEYYHIHRIGEHSSIWAVGNRINWVQKKKNLFYDHYNNNGFFYNDDTGLLPFRQAISRFLDSPQEKQESEYLKLITALSHVVKDQSMFTREQVFEEVRTNYFPHLPSRQTCIWVCNREAVAFWLKALNVKHCKILKLNLTGSLFETDQRHLIADTYRHDDFRSKAFEYWTGTDNTDPIDQEILFEGIIDVVAEYPSLEAFSTINSDWLTAR